MMDDDVSSQGNVPPRSLAFNTRCFSVRFENNIEDEALYDHGVEGISLSPIIVSQICDDLNTLINSGKSYPSLS
jgi:hypothetical protein